MYGFVSLFVELFVRHLGEASLGTFVGGFAGGLRGSFQLCVMRGRFAWEASRIKWAASQNVFLFLYF